MDDSQDLSQQADGQVVEPDQPAEAPVKVCITCRMVRDSNASYCPECGRPLVLAPPGQDTAPEPEQPLLSNSAQAPPSAPAEPAVLPPEEQAPAAPMASIGPDSIPPDALPPTCSCGQVLPHDACFCYRCGLRVGDVQPEFRLIRTKPDNLPPVDMPVGDELTIGKTTDCHLVVEDDFVSRRHARVFRNDRMLMVEDLGSSNGTFLRVRQPIVLGPGDEILLGTTVLRLEQR